VILAEPSASVFATAISWSRLSFSEHLSIAATGGIVMFMGMPDSRLKSFYALTQNGRAGMKLTVADTGINTVMTAFVDNPPVFTMEPSGK
jgi:hypothetical protein